MKRLPLNSIRSTSRYVAELEGNVVYKLEGDPSNGGAVKPLIPVSATAGTVQTSADGTNFTAVGLDGGDSITKGDLLPFVRVTETAVVTFFAI